MKGHDDEAKQKFKVEIFERENLVRFKIKITKYIKRTICVSFLNKKKYWFTKYFGLARAEKKKKVKIK